MKLFHKLLVPLLLLPLFSAVQAAEFELGVHYAELTVPIRVADVEKIEVTEYFSYGCPHCYQFEPLISAWKTGLEADIAFNRTPAIWNRDYQIYAQTYYTIEALGVTENVHGALFDAIQRQQKRLNDPKDMALYLADYDVDPIEFARIYKSFGVRASLQQAEARGRAYRAGGVPTIIVNGKYRVEGSMAGGSAEMLEVVDYLIEKERSSRQST